MGQFQPADPGIRRKALWEIGGAMLLGFCAILASEYFQVDVQSWLERNINYLAQHPVVVFLVVLTLVSPLVAAGLYLLLLGKRVVQAQRFPPPGYAVVRDTPVLQGTPAIRRGRMVQVASLLVVVGAVAIPLIFTLLFGTLGNAG